MKRKMVLASPWSSKDKDVECGGTEGGGAMGCTTPFIVSTRTVSTVSKRGVDVHMNIIYTTPCFQIFQLERASIDALAVTRTILVVPLTV